MTDTNVQLGFVCPQCIFFKYTERCNNLALQNFRGSTRTFKTYAREQPDASVRCTDTFCKLLDEEQSFTLGTQWDPSFVAEAKAI